ncbi:hypothetical protein RUM44_006610 [Polyplax serrata]|uniref:Uncharacterized protein n=1 Tax=Polyplax serrata TaxID=468196 RepID=A0ABR1AIM2_POLSC
MLTKKCKKSVRSLGTIVILIVYVTIDRYNSATVREQRSKRNPRDPVPEQTTAADNLNSGTVKTIVGYSREFKVRKVLADQVVCRKGDEPVGDENSGDTSKWKFDRRLGMHLFSAHLDLREDPYRYIRIIGLAPRNVSVYCQCAAVNLPPPLHTTRCRPLPVDCVSGTRLEVPACDHCEMNYSDDHFQCPAVFNSSANIKTACFRP